MTASFEPIKPEELPYLDSAVAKQWPPPLMPFHDGNCFHFWVALPNHMLQPLAIADITESIYLAAAPARTQDVRFQFFDWAVKRASSPSAAPFIKGILSDVFNLSASLIKIDLLFTHQLGGFPENYRFALTEIEYVLIVCRSLFDLLQEIVKRTWGEVKLNDSSVKKQELPDSFAAIALNGNARRTAQELREKYGLPEVLGAFYEECSDFFVKLRAARNAIIHEPARDPLLFRLDCGYAVNVTEKPFNMIEWPPEGLAPNQLGSLRRWLAYCIKQSLLACELFSRVITSCVQFPSDFAPRHHVFLRSPHLCALYRIDEILYRKPWSSFLD